MRRYRSERDISQDGLARLVGVSTSAISQIERGVNHPRRDTAEAIDGALGANGELLVAFGYNNDSTTAAGPDILELATELRHSLAKSSSRDEKLREILDAATRAAIAVEDVVVEVEKNRYLIVQIAEALGLEVDPELTPSN